MKKVARPPRISREMVDPRAVMEKNPSSPPAGGWGVFGLGPESRSERGGKPPPGRAQHPLGGQDAPVLGFFAQGKTRKIGMGELEAGTVEGRQDFALAAPQAAGNRPAHGVAVAENVEAGGKAADIGMDSFQLRQDALGPGLPRGFEEPAAAFRPAGA